MRANLAFLLALLSLFAPTRASRIITSTIHVPHQLYDLSDNTTRRTTVPFTLYARAPVRRSPLLILLPGALIPVSDYQRLSSAFAYRGFIVAIPQYDQRPPPATILPQFVLAHINATSALTPPCPPRGQFASAALLSSFLAHATQRSRSHWLLRSMLVDRTVVFGHSFGGAAAMLFVTGQCAGLNPFDASRFSFLCEQVAPLPRAARIVGVALFEGLPVPTPVRLALPAGLFLSVMDSPFDGTDTQAVVQPNGRLVEARISHANHYAPNDFSDATMRPPCALERAREASFRTDLRTQRSVISAVATVVGRSYLVFYKRRARELLTRLPRSLPRVQWLSIS